ncbi:MAG: hypothetical protein KDK36_02535 [Leptospiraceae bacterium]|nr:hypothetical protein [Leptospiraceae bacterium]
MFEKNRRARIGSLTAKGGFLNEKAICDIFNDWKKSDLAKDWLIHMGYDLKKINEVIAIQIPTRISRKDSLKYRITDAEYDEATKFKKADAQIKIFIELGNVVKVENLSLKKANSDSNFNQVDKRSVDTYQKMWGFDNDLAHWLKLFTGQILPKEEKSLISSELREFNKRIYVDEFPKRMASKLLDFLESKKILIVSDIIKGRGSLSADWILVTKHDVNTLENAWVLVDINLAMNYFGNGEIKISPRGSISIGKITMRRKGGTPDPTSLQFKINPCGLFDLEV